MSLLSCFPIPFNGFLIIFRNTFTTIVAVAKNNLRMYKALFSCFSIPFYSLTVVFSYTLTIIVTHTKKTLRFSVSCLCCHKKPFRGFPIAFRLVIRQPFLKKYCWTCRNSPFLSHCVFSYWLLSFYTLCS